MFNQILTIINKLKIMLETEHNNLFKRVLNCTQQFAQTHVTACYTQQFVQTHFTHNNLFKCVLNITICSNACYSVLHKTICSNTCYKYNVRLKTHYKFHQVVFDRGDHSIKLEYVNHTTHNYGLWQPFPFRYNTRRNLNDFYFL